MQLQSSGWSTPDLGGQNSLIHAMEITLRAQFVVQSGLHASNFDPNQRRILRQLIKEPEPEPMNCGSYCSLLQLDGCRLLHCNDYTIASVPQSSGLAVVKCCALCRRLSALDSCLPPARSCEPPSPPHIHLDRLENVSLPLSSFSRSACRRTICRNPELRQFCKVILFFLPFLLVKENVLKLVCMCACARRMKAACLIDFMDLNTEAAASVVCRPHLLNADGCLSSHPLRIHTCVLTARDAWWP